MCGVGSTVACVVSEFYNWLVQIQLEGDRQAFISPDYSPDYCFLDEIVHMFSMTHPKIVFCDGDIHSTVVQALRLVDETVSVPVYTVNCRLYCSQTADRLISDEGLNEAEEANFT